MCVWIEVPMVDGPCVPQGAASPPAAPCPCPELWPGTTTSRAFSMPPLTAVLAHGTAPAGRCQRFHGKAT